MNRCSPNFFNRYIVFSGSVTLFGFVQDHSSFTGVGSGSQERGCLKWQENKDISRRHIIIKVSIVGDGRHAIDHPIGFALGYPKSGTCRKEMSKLGK